MLNIFAEALLLAARLDRPKTIDHRRQPLAEFHDNEPKRPSHVWMNGR